VLHSVGKNYVITNSGICLFVDSFFNDALEGHWPDDFFKGNFKRYQILHVLNDFLIALQDTFLLHNQLLLKSDCFDLLHQNGVHLQIYFNDKITFFEILSLGLNSFGGLSLFIDVEDLLGIFSESVKLCASCLQSHSCTVNRQESYLLVNVVLLRVEKQVSVGWLTLRILRRRWRLIEQPGRYFDNISLDPEALIYKAFISHLLEKRGDEIDVSINHDEVLNVSVNFFGFDLIWIPRKVLYLSLRIS